MWLLAEERHKHQTALCEWLQHNCSPSEDCHTGVVLMVRIPGVMFWSWVCNARHQLGDRKCEILISGVPGFVRAGRAVRNTLVFQTETQVVANGLYWSIWLLQGFLIPIINTTFIKLSTTAFPFPHSLLVSSWNSTSCPCLAGASKSHFLQWPSPKYTKIMRLYQLTRHQNTFEWLCARVEISQHNVAYILKFAKMWNHLLRVG